MTALGNAVQRLAARAGVSIALTPVVGSSREAQRTAGTVAAAVALADAGCAAGTVQGHAGDGRPLWPDEYTGSIAHTDHDAVAAAVARGTAVALGVDIERSGALDAADAQLVLDERERTMLDRHRRADWAATMLWSAKESAFKAWSTATEGGLGQVDPADIHVELDERGHSFMVEASGALGAAVRSSGAASGFYVEADGCVVTVVVLRVVGSG